MLNGDKVAFRKSARIVAVVAVLALSLTGCSNSATTSSSSASDTDITDAILTNRSSDCADYSASYIAKVTDVKRNLGFVADFNVSDDASSCSVTSNDIPNYDFNDASAHFAEDVAEQNIAFSVPRNPKAAGSSTELSLLTYNAVMLNGVVLDLIANGCYLPNDPAADADGNVANGCGLTVDWRLDPMGPVGFGTDSHNGHTQPGGLYHYHGNPNALVDLQDTTKESPVIGFAADGFPIYGPNYLDSKTGKISAAKSGFTLKSGSRPTGDSSPGGSYDGTYIQDYEFTGAGTLDKCNGMTVNGHYGYYVTASYPYVMSCYTGTPDLSFFKFWEIARWIIGGLVAFIVILAFTIVLLVRRRRRRKSNATTQIGAQ